MLEQVKQNMKDRLQAFSLPTTNMAKVANTAVDNLTGLRPVPAITDSIKYAGDGVLDFVKKQGEITRRWLSGVGSRIR